MFNKSNSASIEFIKEKLALLANAFKTIAIKYAYNDVINTHVVELTPVNEYYNNEALDKYWIPISLDFKRLFENEDITFISSDSLLSVANPEFEWNAGNKATDLRSSLPITKGNFSIPEVDQSIGLA
ncbi:hypothetical protein [Chitinophaga filiformis]|uniref:Uncharacterized protein n=1 Tax=Chitinophaga filiformis TaxID=104663 RepID=A0ABY4HUA0_CHIFI|nr:hypothetical protein [Chitinophaga filiformis]UPK66584.1 hypothetical protein MYF79_16720 [Chitinophaga filiformis]